MNLVDEVLAHPAIEARPPVLIDIGASGQIHGAWRRLAPHAVCVAFDADARDFDASTRRHPYRTLHLHNAIVTAESGPELDFYLTRAPHCSSSLPPDNAALASWRFAELFDVERKVRLRACRLPEVLAEHGLSYVDWFKTDSQGTDLRLFLSLGDEIARRVLHVSFEPGLIDAYRGEDKLHAVLARMERLPFWIHDLDVRGTQRLSRSWWERLRIRTGGWPPLRLRDAPGWVEIAYLNEMVDDGFDRRDLLLGWVLSTLHGQHGHAAQVADRGRLRFGDAIFAAMCEASLAATVGLVDRLPTTVKKGVHLLRELRSKLPR